MEQSRRVSAFILGAFLFIGLSSLGYLLANAAIEYKQYERSVNVKGLSEHEYEADIVIWPIQFVVVGNELDSLYDLIDGNVSLIKELLTKNGIHSEEISFTPPAITDKTAQQYGNESKPEFRYNAFETVTVYSSDIKKVRSVMGKLSELGKRGIVFTGDDYQFQTEYIFTRLNEVKPKMIEEATISAREVAQKFAFDSKSKLGKIKKASQGLFSISERDKNHPHIKKVRVVSTVEYYLSD